MTEEVHDTSRLDGYLRSRQRVALMNASWRPMLAGAVGACVVIACAWVAMPKFTVRAVEVPKIVIRDVTADHVITRDVPINNPVPHNVEIDIPRIVTPAERAFIERPEYQSTDYHGRIVEPRQKRALSFDNGADFFPVDPAMADDSSGLIGSYGFCNKDPIDPYWHCFAIRDDVVRPVPLKPAEGRPT